MNDESAMFQRDQMKKPNIQRNANSNLSSPFPFMEFGLNAHSSLNNILISVPRENDINKKANITRMDNSTDAHLRPLNLDRFKPVNALPNGIPSFIRSSNNDIRNNDFSANIFLRLQSARTDSTPKPLRTNTSFISYDRDRISSKTNGPKYLNRDQRPNTAVLSLRRSSTLLDQDIYTRIPAATELDPSRATSTTPQILSINGSVMPVVGTQTGTKFYTKSFKTDALIYNSHEKLFTKDSKKDVPSTKMETMSTDPIDAKNPNHQSLYLQVKHEVAEYRKQRLKELNIDLNNIPNLKLKPVDDIITNKEDRGKTALVRDIREEKAVSKNGEDVKEEKVIKKKPLPKNSEDSLGEDLSTTKERKSMQRSKSVTFSDRVETREIMDDSQSDIERSQTPDDSDETSSTDGESQGSVVSTDSESEDNTSTASFSATPNNSSPLSPQAQTKISMNGLVSCKEENIDSNTSSSEEENDSATKHESDCETGSPTISDKSVFNGEAICNETILQKSLTSTESSSRPISSSSNNISNSISVSRTASASSSARNSSKTPTKKFDSNIRNKSNFSKQDLLDMKVFKETQLNMPLIFSKYPFVSPVVNFVGEGEKVEQLPWQLRKLLRWRTSLLTPVIVKQIITRSGFRPSRLTTATDDLENVETNDWILYFGKHMKGPVFSTLKNYQKVNHFPGSFQLGRKDRLWRNIYKMQQEVGKKEFDFIPQTFCLPTDLELFKQCWENGGSKHKWIIKPPASARGIGVKVVYKWNQIPKRRPVVVQRYISNPYLINDSKFDLRLYVYLASIDPLRIYLYDDGLVRFASTKYTNSVKSLHNRFVHLTNYSVNKLNVEYLDNNDNEACKGHKWSLKSLWSYLRKRGVNTDIVWDRIKDLVVKTVISAEEMIGASVKAYCTTPYNVKELFGFDVLLDENLKPWILEVNVSPSLHSDTPLDVTIKGGMIKDVLNLSGFMLPELVDIDPPSNVQPKPSNTEQSPSSDLHIDQRFWMYTPSEDEEAKIKHFVSLSTNGQTGQRFDFNSTLPYQILDCLTPNDVRCLVDCYDEYERRGRFQRLYPVPSTNLVKKYLSCCERVRYSNLLLATFLTKFYHNGQDIRLLEKLCQKKLHLLSSERGDKIDYKHVWRRTSFSGDN